MQNHFLLILYFFRLMWLLHVGRSLVQPFFVVFCLFLFVYFCIFCSCIFLGLMWQLLHVGHGLVQPYAGQARHCQRRQHFYPTSFVFFFVFLYLVFLYFCIFCIFVFLCFCIFMLVFFAGRACHSCRRQHFYPSQSPCFPGFHARRPFYLHC